MASLFVLLFLFLMFRISLASGPVTRALTFHVAWKEPYVRNMARIQLRSNGTKPLYYPYRWFAGKGSLVVGGRSRSVYRESSAAGSGTGRQAGEKKCWNDSHNAENNLAPGESEASKWCRLADALQVRLIGRQSGEERKNTGGSCDTVSATKAPKCQYPSAVLTPLTFIYVGHPQRKLKNKACYV